MSTTFLPDQPEFLETLEIDLCTKSKAAFDAAGIQASVHGVFSLDDLEGKMANEISSGVSVGVGYQRALPGEIETNPRGTPGSAPSAKFFGFNFLVVLCVPTQPGCLERYNGTRLLTVLRRHIHGSLVEGTRGEVRPWNFMGEVADTANSTENMLYYVQTWQIALPVKSK